MTPETNTHFPALLSLQNMLVCLLFCDYKPVPQWDATRITWIHCRRARVVTSRQKPVSKRPEKGRLDFPTLYTGSSFSWLAATPTGFIHEVLRGHLKCKCCLHKWLCWHSLEKQVKPVCILLALKKLAETDNHAFLCPKWMCILSGSLRQQFLQ